MHRDLPDGVRHVLDGNREERVGDLFDAAAIVDLACESLEAFPDDVGIERLVLIRPEHGRKEIRLELAGHDVGVGDCEGAAEPVRCRARDRAGRFRSGLITAAGKGEDRSAACRDGVDAHHRCAEANSGDLGIEVVFERAVIVRDVGRRASHVEADDAVEPCHRRGLDRADDTAGGAGEDCVLAAEMPCGGEAARGLHEKEVGHFTKRGGNAVDMAAKDRREVGIDDSRVAAADELQEGRHFMARRDLTKARLTRELGDDALMFGERPGVHEDDGDGVDAIRAG